MRTWTNPEVEAIEISTTANGGKPSMDFDQQWNDQNGALHVNFVDSNQPS